MFPVLIERGTNKKKKKEKKNLKGKTSSLERFLNRRPPLTGGPTTF